MADPDSFEPEKLEAPPPLPPQRRGLSYADLSEEQLQEFFALNDHGEQIKLLCKFLSIKRYTLNTRAAIFVDFCFLNLMYAHNEAQPRFTEEKTSCFFSIMKQVFEDATSTQCAIEDSYTKFKEYMMTHSVDIPPNSVAVFDVLDVKNMTEFVSKTFYRHFKLYQYTFAQKQEEECVVKELVVETPLEPEPMNASGPREWVAIDSSTFEQADVESEEWKAAEEAALCENDENDENAEA
jgi:hypothetical protein